MLLKLPEYFAASGYREPDPPAQGPYPFISGGKTFWERAVGEPILQERFDNFMNAQRVGPNWIDLVSMDEVFRPGLREDPDAVLLVDIGGGVGHDLKYFKQKHGHLPGRLVVADLPATIDYARQKPHDGVELQPYDMFTTQPIKGKSLARSPGELFSSVPRLKVSSRCPGVLLPHRLPRLARLELQASAGEHGGGHEAGILAHLDQRTRPTRPRR